MNSVQKVFAAIAQLEGSTDEELRAAFPSAPPGIVRAALPFVIDAVPTDPAQLDEFLTGVGDFCHSLRSDDVAAQPAA